MNELEKKLEACTKLHMELREAHATLTMKNGQFEDLMKDICTNHLGFGKDQTEIPLPEILKKAYLEGKK